MIITLILYGEIILTESFDCGKSVMRMVTSNIQEAFTIGEVEKKI